jgi:cytochrome P450
VVSDLDRLDWLRDNFDPMVIGPENVWDVVDYMHARCPVAHGQDERGDFYVVGRYGDVLSILQDWHTFANNMHARVGVPELPLEMPPIDVNPPFQRHLRQILNPYFAPQKVTEYEPGARALIGELVKQVPEEPFDIASALFQPLPPTLTFRLLLGLESSELSDARHWVDEVLFGAHDHDVGDSAAALMEWLFSLVTRRRSAEDARPGLIDALVHGTVEGGRPLTEEEVAGTLLILLLGGFITTTDAASTFLVRLAEHPELQSSLRADKSRLPDALEEHLRLMPPVPILPRLCTADVEIAGREVKAGYRVAYMVVAANRDPDEFEDPNQFIMGRARNRHLAFGGGVHRCIGSNFARMSLRVLFEELLTHFPDISMAEGESVRWVARGAAEWYHAQRIPVILRRPGVGG